MTKRYNNLDTIRMIACLGIVLVHILKNTNLTGLQAGVVFDYILNNFLLKLEKFVSLFFILSGFSISCGYYNKIRNNEMSIVYFYKRRYLKIYPLFALLVLFEASYLLLTHSITLPSAFMECIADGSLSFAFLPFSNLSIVGVGWALGVIFAFYMVYPFLVFCLYTKKQAWIVLFVSIILSYGARNYFSYNGIYSNANFALWAQYFIAGIIVYLYREKITACLKRMSYAYMLIFVAGVVISFQLSFASVFMENAKNLVAWALVLISLLGNDISISNSRVVKTCSKFSFEIYLLHMPILRFFQKTPLFSINSIQGILLGWIVVFVLALISAYVFDTLLSKIQIFMKWSKNI